MKFKQIAGDFPIKNKGIPFLLVFIIALALAITLYVIQQRFQTPVIVLVSIILLSAFLMNRSRRLLSDWTSDKDIVGEINFEKDAITFNENESISHEDIRHIHFRFNYIKGLSPAPKGNSNNGLAALHITTKDNETQTIKFVIETKEQFEFLKSMFKKWYRSSIVIKEESGNLKHKTICLEFLGTMSYKDIQALKEDIKPSSQNN